MASVTCPHYEPLAGSRRCVSYADHGGCRRPDLITCVEWAKVNTPTPSLPLVGDSLASIDGSKPARKPGRLRRVDGCPEAPWIAPAGLDDCSGALGAPVTLGVSSAELIASYGHCPVDLRFVADGLGELWLVPEYTNRRAREIRIDHVTTLGQALETFPGSRVAAMRDANHVLAEAQPARESIKAQAPKEKRGELSQIDPENTRCQVKGTDFFRSRGERGMEHVEDTPSPIHSPHVCAHERSVEDHGAAGAGQPSSRRATLPSVGERPSHAVCAASLETADVESFAALGATICLSSKSLGELWLVPAYTGAPRREIAAPHAAMAIGALCRLPGVSVVGVADRPREAGWAICREVLS